MLPLNREWMAGRVLRAGVPALERTPLSAPMVLLRNSPFPRFLRIVRLIQSREESVKIGPARVVHFFPFWMIDDSGSWDGKLRFRAWTFSPGRIIGMRMKIYLKTGDLGLFVNRLFHLWIIEGRLVLTSRRSIWLRKSSPRRFPESVRLKITTISRPNEWYKIINLL